MERLHAVTVFLVCLLLSSWLASFGLFVASVFGATVFSDGFETNNFSAWSGNTTSATGTVTTVTSAPHHGTYNMNSTIAAASSDQWAAVYYGSLANAYSTLYMRGYVQWNSNPTVNPNILPFLGYWQDLGANSMVRAGVGYNGTVHWGMRYRASGAFTSVFGNSVPVVNTVYCVELMIVRSATVGAVQLWVDGVSEISVTGLDNTDRNLNYAYFGFNSFVAAESAAKVFQGDCYVLSTTYVGTEDVGAPTFSAIASVNGTDYYPGYGYNYSCTISDAGGISGYISSTNVTGSWINGTWTSAANATTKTLYITGTHNTTKGNTDSYKVYANDTSNNNGTSTQYNFLLTDTFAAWLTYESLISHYNFLVFQNSSIVSKEVMGNTSVNGIQFYVYKFGTNTTRKFLVDASVHGHEQYNAHAVLWMAQWLVGSANGSAVLANMQVCIVPSMNPDYFGTEHRKNVNDVDLNRNHILGWASGDSDPDSDYYRGPSAESEPETEALNDLFASLQPDIYVSAHDWGGNLYGNSTDTGGYFKYENYGSTTFLANSLNLYNNYTAVLATKSIGAAHLVTSGSAAGFAYDDAYSIPANDTCLAYLWEETDSTKEEPLTVALIRDNKTVHLESFIEGAVNYFNALGGGQNVSATLSQTLTGSSTIAAPCKELGYSPSVSVLSYSSGLLSKALGFQSSSTINVFPYLAFNKDLGFLLGNTLSAWGYGVANSFLSFCSSVSASLFPNVGVGKEQGFTSKQSVQVLDNGLTSDPSNWWNTDFAYRKKVTFNNLAITENLVNFAVPVTFTSGNTDFWGHIQTNGNDTRFVDADNSTELYYELETFSHTTDSMIAWVKVPQINSASATDFMWLYYGNGSCGFDGYNNKTMVWDANYVLVMHFNEASGNHTDSTQYGNNANYTSATTQGSMLTGKIGAGDYLGGTPKRIDVPASSSLQWTTLLTAELWVNHTVNSGWQSMLHKYPDTADHKQVYLEFEADGDINNYNTISMQSSPCTVNQWYYIAYSTDNVNETLYRNGSILKEQADAFVSMNNTYNFMIGAATTAAEYLLGCIDEVRLSNISRSDAWILASYQYETDQSKLTVAAENQFSTSMLFGKELGFLGSSLLNPFGNLLFGRELGFSSSQSLRLYDLAGLSIEGAFNVFEGLASETGNLFDGLGFTKELGFMSGQSANIFGGSTLIRELGFLGSSTLNPVSNMLFSKELGFSSSHSLTMFDLAGMNREGAFNVYSFLTGQTGQLFAGLSVTKELGFGTDGTFQLFPYGAMNKAVDVLASNVFNVVPSSGFGKELAFYSGQSVNLFANRIFSGVTGLPSALFELWGRGAEVMSKELGFSSSPVLWLIDWGWGGGAREFTFNVRPLLQLSDSAGLMKELLFRPSALANLLGQNSFGKELGFLSGQVVNVFGGNLFGKELAFNPSGLVNVFGGGLFGRELMFRSGSTVNLFSGLSQSKELGFFTGQTVNLFSSNGVGKELGLALVQTVNVFGGINQYNAWEFVSGNMLQWFGSTGFGKGLLFVSGQTVTAFSNLSVGKELEFLGSGAINIYGNIIRSIEVATTIFENVGTVRLFGSGIMFGDEVTVESVLVLALFIIAMTVTPPVTILALYGKRVKRRI